MKSQMKVQTRSQMCRCSGMTNERSGKRNATANHYFAIFHSGAQSAPGLPVFQHHPLLDIMVLTDTFLVAVSKKNLKF